MIRKFTASDVTRIANKCEAQHIGYEFVMNDNLEGAIYESETTDTFIGHPIKLVGANIVFCIHGDITYRVNLSEYTLDYGSMLIIPPESVMEITSVSADIKMMTINASDQYIDSALYNALLPFDSTYIKMPKHVFDECISIFRLMKTRLLSHDPQESKPIIQQYMMVLCCILKQIIEINQSNENVSQGKSNLFNRYIASVKQNYHKHRNLKFYADDLCVTAKHLSMMVKKESDKNASDIIRDLIIFEAKAMLNSREYTIEQISDHFNFPNQSFFSKFFRQQTGLTPTAYRKSNR